MPSNPSIDEIEFYMENIVLMGSPKEDKEKFFELIKQKSLEHLQGKSWAYPFQYLKISEMDIRK